jgi:hypothetical protein
MRRMHLHSNSDQHQPSGQQRSRTSLTQCVGGFLEPAIITPSDSPSSLGAVLLRKAAFPQIDGIDVARQPFRMALCGIGGWMPPLHRSAHLIKLFLQAHWDIGISRRILA